MFALQDEEGFLVLTGPLRIRIELCGDYKVGTMYNARVSTVFLQRHRYREVKPQISADINQLKNCVGRQHFVNTFTFKKNLHNNCKVKYIESFKHKYLKMNKLS